MPDFIVKTLVQRTNLYRIAFATTRDPNEAHLLVHGVMARALARGATANDDVDLGREMDRAAADWPRLAA